MRDFKFLKFLDWFRPLFEKLGVDYFVMRKILQVKLIMDGRRVPTVLSNKTPSAESDTNFFKSLGIYLLMGLTLLPFVWMRQNYIYQMSIVFTIIMFFIMTSLISDFSSVLLDIKDKNIIGTKPLQPKTLHLAKTIHLSLYLFYITAALVGPALCLSLYRQGILFFLIFLVTIILLDVLIIVLTSLVYLFVLRFFDGEKLKDIINYIQIILTIVISVGYQIFIRLFNVMNLDIHFEPKWWQFLIPPIWFSAPFQMLKKSEINTTYIIFGIMTIVIPIVALTLYIKLIPIFEENLQKLSNHTERIKKVNRRPDQLLSWLLCNSNEERIFFRFTSAMMKSEREYKLKVYPSIGLAIAFPYIFLFQQISALGFKEVSQGKSYYLIYFCGLMLPTVMWMLRYSAAYKGAWIYKALPINDPAPIFRGTIKAVITKLFFPIFLLQAISFLIIFGVRILPDLLIVFVNIMIINIASFLASEKSLPFSEEYKSAQQSNGLIAFLSLFGLAALAGIHLTVTRSIIGAYVYFVVAVIVFLVFWLLTFRSISFKIKDF